MRDDTPKEEIRRRVDVVAYISRYVPLKRSGRRFRGRCPFHQERNPSFYVDPATGIWKCFGCGAAGDIFTFVQRIQNLTFVEAAEQLAAEVGVRWQPGGRGDQARSLRQAILRANELAMKFYAEQLMRPIGSRALEYLRARGLSEETIARFGLGYAPPDGHALQRYLSARGVSADVIARAGLSHSGGLDMFIDRVIFPVHDVTGRVIGFGGRTLSEGEQAKYVNSPDSPIFHKGQTLYGLHLARTAAGQRGQLVVVEGYMDVIALHQAGFENAVASLGTALTLDHLRIASRYADEIVLAYDADAAGLQAALRDISMFEKCPAEVRIALLPEGHDPDSLVRQVGPEAFVAAIEAACQPAELKLRQILSAADAERRAEVLSQAADVLLEIADHTKRADLLDRVADWWGGNQVARTAAMRRALWLEVRRRLRQRLRDTPQQDRQEAQDEDVIVQTVARTQNGLSPGRERLERTLLTWALNDPDIACELFAAVPAEAFCTPALRPIAEALAAQASRGEFAPDALLAALDANPPAQEALAELLLLGYSPPEREELTGAIQKLKALHTAGVDALNWEAACQASLAAAAEEDAQASSLEKLRAEVAARLDEGDISPEDPVYKAYSRLVAMLHGRGDAQYYEQHHMRRPPTDQRGSRRWRRSSGGGTG